MKITSLASSHFHPHSYSPPKTKAQKSASATKYRWPALNLNNKLHLHNITIIKLSSSQPQNIKGCHFKMPIELSNSFQSYRSNSSKYASFRAKKLKSIRSERKEQVLSFSSLEEGPSNKDKIDRKGINAETFRKYSAKNLRAQSSPHLYLPFNSRKVRIDSLYGKEHFNIGLKLQRDTKDEKRQSSIFKKLEKKKIYVNNFHRSIDRPSRERPTKLRTEPRKEMQIALERVRKSSVSSHFTPWQRGQSSCEQQIYH